MDKLPSSNLIHCSLPRETKANIKNVFWLAVQNLLECCYSKKICMTVLAQCVFAQGIIKISSKGIPR